MAQITPEPAYDHELARRVIDYLQTGDSRFFPFSARFDEEQRKAFVRDLREGLASLLDSGSARKTSATGKIVSDRRLHEIVHEWRSAGGGWPEGADPDAIDTALGAIDDDDPADDLELESALVPDEYARDRS